MLSFLRLFMFLVACVVGSNILFAQELPAAGAAEKLTVAQLNELVKKLGGHEEALLFMRGHYMISPAIRFSYDGNLVVVPVKTDATDWKTHVSNLEKGGILIDPWLRAILKSVEPEPTVPAGEYEVVIVNGKDLMGCDSTYNQVLRSALKMGLAPMSPEMAPYLAKKFSVRDIDGSVVVMMTEPIRVQMDEVVQVVATLYHSYREDQEGDALGIEDLSNLLPVYYSYAFMRPKCPPPPPTKGIKGKPRERRRPVPPAVLPPPQPEKG